MLPAFQVEDSVEIQLSGRQRLELAVLFYRWQPEGDVLSAIKTYGRTRLALGLTPIMDLLAQKRPMNPARVNDDMRSFVLTEEGVDLLLSGILPKIGGATAAYQATQLGDLVETLQTYKVTKTSAGPGQVPRYEPEDWSITLDTLDPIVEALVAAAGALAMTPKELYGRLQEALDRQVQG